MKRMLSLLAMLLFCLCCTPLPSSFAAETKDLSALEYTAQLAVYSISGEKRIRLSGETADLTDLAQDEYYTYYLLVRNTGEDAVNLENLYVRIDGGENKQWGASTLEAGASMALHVYYGNMKDLQLPGEHTAVWYLNDQAVCTKSFILTSGGSSSATAAADAKWAERLIIPSASEIAAANSAAAVRSPYLYGWLSVGDSSRYTEYAVDFKADHLPQGTYCALANLKMDLSSLEKKYKNVHNEYSGVSMYAGFQRNQDDYKTIMSAWDVYYTDDDGIQQTLRPVQLYPDENYWGDGTFSGEGTGIQMLVPYAWEAGHWYRMLLQCGESENGTTTVTQWVCDLESGVWTKMSCFDTLIQDSCFMGNCAFFLENFNTAYAGEIRSMEVCNARVRDAETGQWRAVSSACIGSNGGLPKYNGSYAYGSSGSSFWMITSGVGGDWYGTDKAPKNNAVYTVTGGESTSPY